VRLPTAKRLRWHIDYLLDEPDAELAGVWAWRTAEPLESRLAEWLAAQAGVVPLAVRRAVGRWVGGQRRPGADAFVASDKWRVAAVAQAVSLSSRAARRRKRVVSRSVKPEGNADGRG